MRVAACMSVGVFPAEDMAEPSAVSTDAAVSCFCLNVASFHGSQNFPFLISEKKTKQIQFSVRAASILITHQNPLSWQVAHPRWWHHSRWPFPKAGKILQKARRWAGSDRTVRHARRPGDEGLVPPNIFFPMTPQGTGAEAPSDSLQLLGFTGEIYGKSDKVCNPSWI